MKISTKGRYALRIMADMAVHRDDGYIPLRDIAERQGISKNYLDQIMILLNRTDFLKTARGPQGGYKLARDPASYTVGEIVRSTESNLILLPCLENCGEDCQRSAVCLTRPVWQGLKNAMSHYLDSVTLQDIAANHVAVSATHSKS